MQLHVSVHQAIVNPVRWWLKMLPVGYFHYSLNFVFLIISKARLHGLQEQTSISVNLRPIILHVWNTLKNRQTKQVWILCSSSAYKWVSSVRISNCISLRINICKEAYPVLDPRALTWWWCQNYKNNSQFIDSIDLFINEKLLLTSLPQLIINKTSYLFKTSIDRARMI